MRSLTGDVVEHGDEDRHWKASRAALSKLKMPIVVLIGNHDYRRSHSGERDAPDEELVRGDLGLIGFMQHYHPYLAPRFDFGGYGFIGLDTGMSATARDALRLALITTAGITRGQLADLGQFMSNDARRGHVIMGHTPTRTSLTGTKEGKVARSGAFEQGAKALERLLVQQNKPVVFLSGHVHWNDIFSVPRRDGPGTFVRRNVKHKRPGRPPCLRDLRIGESPLMVSTQSATKDHPLRSNDGFGFRWIRVGERAWHSASYRFDDDNQGAIDGGAEQVNTLSACED